jgi:putative hydrolase of the HAD superfamily
MKPKGIIFDLYGTLIDIETDESMEEIYRAIAHFLTYQGITMNRWELKGLYFRLIREQKETSTEKHPEVNVIWVWDRILDMHGVKSSPYRKGLARTIAQFYRGISRKRLKLYPGTREALEALYGGCKLALVTDAQRCYAIPEIKAVSIEGFFQTVIISSDYGFRKPDRRMAGKALARLRMGPEEVLFVGNDMYRDIYGARLLGMKTVLFLSNQGARSYEDTAPDYSIQELRELLTIVSS